MEKKYFENIKGGLHGLDTYTPIGRIAFVDLVNPRAYVDQEGKASTPRYGVTLLIPKEMDEQTQLTLKKIKAEVSDLREAWLLKEFQKLGNTKAKYEAFKESKIGLMQGRPLFRDGDLQKYDGYAGNWYIRANNKARDGKGGILILDGRSPEEFKGGMICRLQIAPLVDGMGVSYKLKAIRLVKDDGFRFKSAAAGAPDLLSGLDDAVEAVKANGAQSVPESSLAQEFDKAIGASSSASSLDILG